MICLTKIKLKGWRTNKKVTVGQVERWDSQIGQLLYYLTALQLRRIQLFLSPSERPNTHGEPHEVLGLFMEQGKVNVCTHTREHRPIFNSYNVDTK